MMHSLFILSFGVVASQGQVVDFNHNCVLDLLKTALSILGQMFYCNKMTPKINLEHTGNTGRPQINIL